MGALVCWPAMVGVQLLPWLSDLIHWHSNNVQICAWLSRPLPRSPRGEKWLALNCCAWALKSSPCWSCQALPALGTGKLSSCRWVLQGQPSSRRKLTLPVRQLLAHEAQLQSIRRREQACPGPCVEDLTTPSALRVPVQQHQAAVVLMPWQTVVTRPVSWWFRHRSVSRTWGPAKGVWVGRRRRATRVLRIACCGGHSGEFA